MKTRLSRDALGGTGDQNTNVDINNSESSLSAACLVALWIVLR